MSHTFSCLNKVEIITILAIFILLTGCLPKLSKQRVQTNTQQKSLQQIEHDLINAYQKISSQREKMASLRYRQSLPADSAWDLLEQYNQTFRRKLAYYTSHYPLTLTYPFDSLRQKADVTIATSPDSLFRIYSWDQRDGGSLHFYSNLFQFKSGGKVSSILAPDTTNDGKPAPHFQYGSVDRLTANAQSTIYLALGGGISSGAYLRSQARAFAIENHTVNDTIRIIKTKSGHLVNSIVQSFNWLLRYPTKHIPNEMEYDSEKKELFIPVIAVSDSMTVGNEVYPMRDSMTTRSDVYRFNGKYFQYIKTVNMASRK